MMKKVILLTLLGITTSLMALGAEQAYLYKDPRIMGMGGTNVAVGSYSTSVFSNPAGLASIKEENGYVVDILGVGLSATSGIQNFVNDLNDAGDNTVLLQAVIEKYSGDAFHSDVSNYTSLSKNSDGLALSIGFLGASDVNFIVHGNGSANGAALELAGRAYGGVVLGGATTIDTSLGRLNLGLGFKYMTQKSYEGPVYLADLQQDDAAQRFQDKYEKSASGIGFDLGLIYEPFKKGGFWNPSLGVSVLNIGSLEMDNNYGGQPMTVNVGMALSPDVSIIDKLVLAVDYVDVLNANVVRTYTYAGALVVHKDYVEGDPMKRLRAGVTIGLLDSTYLSTALSGGMYNGSYTAGVDIEFLLFKMNVATYKEQIGTGSVDIPDRRYMAKIGFGW